MSDSQVSAKPRALPRFLPEVVLVLVSVTMGFGAAQYGEYRNEQSLVVRILHGLTGELARNQALLEPTVPFHAAWVDSLQAASPVHGQSALDIWFDTRPPMPSENATPFVTLARSAWDAALASGSLGLLDYDLVTALSEIYRAQDMVADNVNRLATGALSQTTTFDPSATQASTRLLWLSLADIYTAELMLAELYTQHLPRLQAAAADMQ